jgi:hypothetical protein
VIGPLLTISKLKRWSINYYIDTATTAERMTAALQCATAAWANTTTSTKTRARYECWPGILTQCAMVGLGCPAVRGRSRLCGGGAVAGRRGRAQRCRGAHSARRRCTALLGRLQLAVLDAAAVREFNAFEDGSQAGQNPTTRRVTAQASTCRAGSITPRSRVPPQQSERRPLACHGSITMCVEAFILIRSGE